jgi:Carboxypeptidase regulatory-like domain
MKGLNTRFGARGFNSLALVATFFALLLAWQGPQGFSQTGTGEINGTVTDQSGAVVPGAAITLRNQSTGVESNTSTTSKGVFHFLNVLPGTYVLKVQASGFKIATFPAFVVGVSQLVTKDAQLSVGAVTQTVEVAAHAPLLQSSSTELGSVLTQRAVQDLPLNGRNFMEFLLLQPGATPITTAQGGQNGGGNPDGGIIAIPGAKVARPSFQGSQGRSAIYYTDGIINTDFRSNEPGVPPNPDLIQEFDVVTHDARADFGSVTGAAVNLVTKSGTNQYHGSAFEFVRNNIFNARNTFVAGPLPAFHQNQFGATAGGPIRKNKTFIY